ncbi:MAG: hypothetical protein KGZ42_07610 [Melioribacter sp.]|nr:hypothetical protein [Melioribacter sp.]
MSQLFLSKEEKKDLELIQEKRKNLFLQDQFLTAKWNKIIEDFCKRNSKDVSIAKQVDLDSGLIVFDEKKKGRITKGKM